MQKILSFDATILNTFQSCARKTKYSFVENLRLPEKEEALERGDLIHKMMEVYYSLQLKHFDFDTEVWKEIIASGIQAPISLPERKHQTIVDFSVTVGRYFSTKMDLPTEEIEESIYQFREYAKYYEHDSWCPLAVEEVVLNILFENDDHKFIYNFKVDLVAEKGNVISPFDHKPSKRRQEQTSLSTQFIGYCYGLGMNNIVVNKIGFQKSLTPQQRFKRYTLSGRESHKCEGGENKLLVRAIGRIPRE